MGYKAFSMLMISCVVFCGATQRRFKFTLVPSTNGSGGMQCTSKHVNARGAKFNPQTEICDALPESWFSVQSMEANYVYYKLSMTERLFKPVPSLESQIPANFVIGSSVVLMIKTGSEITGDLVIEFVNKDRTIRALNIKALTGINEVRFNTLVGSWGSEEGGQPNPFATPNTVYKLELVFKQSAIDIKIDDSPLHTYTQRTSITNFQILTFGDDNGLPKCQRIQYFYPA